MWETSLYALHMSREQDWRLIEDEQPLPHDNECYQRVKLNIIQYKVARLLPALSLHLSAANIHRSGIKCHLVSQILQQSQCLVVPRRAQWGHSKSAICGIWQHCFCCACQRGSGHRVLEDITPGFKQPCHWWSCYDTSSVIPLTTQKIHIQTMLLQTKDIEGR